MDTFSDNSRCSSFEALNQHDPNLSQKAKAMFTKVNSYLNYEVRCQSKKERVFIVLSVHSLHQINLIINYWKK